MDRRQIAEVLVRSLASDVAVRKTFELIAERGPAPKSPEDFDALFAPLDADPPGALDAAHDRPNLPLDLEPEYVRADLQRTTVRLNERSRSPIRTTAGRRET